MNSLPLVNASDTDWASDAQDVERFADDGARLSRPYIGVLFQCCGVYTRIYRRPEDNRYVGRCPRCYRIAQVRVGPDGTGERLFHAH